MSNFEIGMMSQLLWQVEGRSQVRKLLPRPGKGDLPLPEGGLPAHPAQFAPQTVEDLNNVVPQGAPQLQTQHSTQVRESEHLSMCGLHLGTGQDSVCD